MIDESMSKFLFHEFFGFLVRGYRRAFPSVHLNSLRFRRLFTPLNHESDKIVKLQRHQVKDAVLNMGSYAVEASLLGLKQGLFPSIFHETITARLG